MVCFRQEERVLAGMEGGLEVWCGEIMLGSEFGWVRRGADAKKRQESLQMSSVCVLGIEGQGNLGPQSVTRV